MTPQQEAFEHALQRWAAQRKETDETRDGLVLGAVSHGISKHRVHVLTGIARTTIDDILSRAKTSDHPETKESGR